MVKKAHNLVELAEQINVPANALQETVTRFNKQARARMDEDFHRGESKYEPYFADPKAAPNACLHYSKKGPFYAFKIVPDDIGTKGGIVTDEHARALRANGSVIQGIWAAGNASAAVMGNSYAGPGSTLAPAMTFGYISANEFFKFIYFLYVSSSQVNYVPNLPPNLNEFRYLYESVICALPSSHTPAFTFSLSFPALALLYCSQLYHDHRNCSFCLEDNSTIPISLNQAHN